VSVHLFFGLGQQKCGTRVRHEVTHHTGFQEVGAKVEEGLATHCPGPRPPQCDRHTTELKNTQDSRLWGLPTLCTEQGDLSVPEEAPLTDDSPWGTEKAQAPAGQLRAHSGSELLSCPRGGCFKPWYFPEAHCPHQSSVAASLLAARPRRISSQSSEKPKAGTWVSRPPPAPIPKWRN
jgi:hypothetical protein